MTRCRLLPHRPLALDCSLAREMIKLTKRSREQLAGENETMDKWPNMLKGIDVATSIGLEFGPLMSPMLTKQMGEAY
jgi:hypothetical protein